MHASRLTSFTTYGSDLVYGLEARFEDSEANRWEMIVEGELAPFMTETLRVMPRAPKRNLLRAEHDPFYSDALDRLAQRQRDGEPVHQHWGSFLIRTA